MITIDGGTGIISHNGVEIASDKMYDQWRLSENETIASAGEVVTDWERPTETGTGTYITGMSHSSGVFTFPKSGIYRVQFTCTFYHSDNKRYVGIQMYISTNSGGSFSEIAKNYTSIYENDSNAYATGTTTMYLDIQDASTYRVRFACNAQNDVTLYGANDETRTTVLFERIAST